MNSCNVWRLHIKTDGNRSHDFCIRKNILGVGWPVKTGKNNLDWGNYYDLGMEEYHNNDDRSWWPAVRAIYERMAINDLCWSRNPSGIYYLGRILSEASYCATPEHIKEDVVNIRKCDWKKIESTDSVPGKIVACFRSPRTAQMIHDSKAGVYSRYLWNKLSGQQTYETEHLDSADIFMMLDDEETENLLFLYLQAKGWHVMPHSRKKDTMRYEFFIANPQSGEKGITQVKTGNSVINRGEFSQHYSNMKVFLFQPRNIYEGPTSENITCITKKELLEFLENSIAHTWLPEWLRTKWEMVTSV